MVENANGWSLVSSHGSVLFVIALNPGITIKDLAKELSLTQRTIWGIIGCLRRANMLQVRREGRQHHYWVNLEAPFLHPIIKGITLKVVLGELISQQKEVPEQAS